MKRFTISNQNNLFLLLTAIGFLMLFLTLSFNNRLAGDDLYFLAMIKKEGLWGCFKGVYMGWSGRWTKTAYWFFVMMLTDNFQHIHYVLFAYHLITLLMMVVSLQVIIRFLFLELFQTVMTKKDTFIFSILFISSFYFFTFDIIESWWWIGSTFAYLQGICFLLAGTALLLRQQKHLFHYCCIGFCFLYVGGCFEIYALFVLGLFAAFIVYGKKAGRWNEWSVKGYLEAVFIALTCLLVSTLICFIAPGNYQRRGIITNEQVILFSSFFKDVHLASTFLLQKRWGVAVLLSSLWILMGMKVREHTNSHLHWKAARNVLLICLETCLGSVLINEFFKMAILKNTLMPSRTFIFASFFIAVFTSLLFLLTGYYFFQTAKRFALLLSLIPCCSMIVLFAYTYKQYGSTTRYAKQHDELINELVLAKTHNPKEVVVQALPDPGMLLLLDVEDLHWALQEILGLPYEIKVKK
jgi:hypothetical protein